MFKPEQYFFPLKYISDPKRIEKFFLDNFKNVEKKKKIFLLRPHFKLQDQFIFLYCPTEKPVFEHHFLSRDPKDNDKYFFVHEPETKFKDFPTLIKNSVHLRNSIPFNFTGKFQFKNDKLLIKKDTNQFLDILESLLLFILIMAIGLTIYYFFITYFFGDSYFDFSNSSIKKTQDKELRLSIPLSSVFLGEKISFQLEGNEICPLCSGTGTEKPEDLFICEKCNGRGIRNVVHRFGPFESMTEEKCPHCSGKGRFRKTTCKKCHGKGILTVNSDFEFQVPKGMPENFKVSFPKRSDQYPGYEPGDVYITVRTQVKDQKFQRLQNFKDLSLNLDITLLEALIGFEKEIEHLDGNLIIIKSNQVRYHGEIMVEKGKGMPIYNSPSQFGDLLIKLSIIFPNSLSQNQQDEVKNLLD